MKLLVRDNFMAPRRVVTLRKHTMITARYVATRLVNLKNHARIMSESIISQNDDNAVAGHVRSSRWSTEMDEDSITRTHRKYPKK